MGLDEVDEISHKDCKLQTGICKITIKIILKRCLWYYIYKKLFCDYSEVNPPTFIDS